MANSARRLLPLAISAALLSSCASPPPPPPPAPVPSPAAAPAPPPPLPPQPADWRDIRAAAGSWTWGIAGGRSTAKFGPPGAAPLAMLSCERSIAAVRIARAGSGAETQVPMALTTTTGSRPLLSAPALGQPGWMVAELRASDPVLDALAFSRGRFVLESAGQAALALPSWPEVSRVIEDCR